MNAYSPVLMAAIWAAPLLSNPSLVNSSFDQGLANGAPAGWTLGRLSGNGDYAVTLVPAEHGQAPRITSTDAAGAIKLEQRINATPWRGKDIELSARVRLEDGARVGLLISVHRPEPNATGTRDQSGSPDAAPAAWTTIHKFAHVDDDALTIDLGLGVVGAGAVSIEDYGVAVAKLPESPASPEAKAYLDVALSRMRNEHLRRKELDWAALEARAHREIAGAQTPRDTYWVIRGLLGTLGDHHSMFIAPTRTSSRPAIGDAPPIAATPEGALIAHRYGLIKLPSVASWGPTGAADSARYVQEGHAVLRRLDKARLCGWIVDLRANSGGDVWPMLNSVAPLLGRPPFSMTVTPEGPTSAATLSAEGEVIEAPVTGGRTSAKASTRLRQRNLAVAVLTSRRTGSAGEDVVIAFVGRPLSRRFGEPTAGYTTANRGEDMSDGAMLAIASGWGRDRLGHEYKDRIEPDEPALAENAVTAAIRWLHLRCRARQQLQHTKGPVFGAKRTSAPGASASVAAGYPRDAGSAELFYKRGFEFNCLPPPQRVKVRDKLRNEPHPMAGDVAARLIAGHVLIEPRVRITRALSYVQPPPAGAAPILEKGNVDVVRGSARTLGCGAQPQRRASSGGHPVCRRRGHALDLPRTRCQLVSGVEKLAEVLPIHARNLRCATGRATSSAPCL